MQVIEYITAGGLLSILGLVYKATRDNDAKVARIYSRLDEVKCDSENKYTHQDVCQVRHLQITNDLSEIKQDVKKLLFKNGIS